ncbi:MAG: glycosyltransferase family 4 protein [Alphaproteobacteria bacterium]
MAAWRGRRADGRSTYIKISHQGLENPLRYRRLKKRAGSRFVVFLHDLIPIRFPEYARPGAAARHRQRVRTIASLADLVVVNSASTARDFADYCQAHRLRQPETATVELAVEPAFMERTAIASNAENYFVCVGTIEPRKNHLLLLNIWRDMILRHGTAAPKLVLIGRRGWENENIFDMLNRCAAFPGHVMWLRTASDEDIRRSLRGARALLMPSFAEGFGLPVAEALALGVPVLSSDLPSLREAGQGVPDYLDPLDGLGWMRAIMDYAAEPSPARIAQLQRLDRFRPISWSDHFSAFERLAFSA